MAQRRTRDETRRQPQGPPTAGAPGEETFADDAPMPALTIVSHPRAHRAGERLLLYALTKGGEVQLSRIEPDFVRRGGVSAEPLDDPYISRKPIVLRPAPGGGITVIVPRAGTPVLCGGTPIEDRIDLAPEKVARGVSLTLADRIVLLLHLSEPVAATSAGSMGMVGESRGICRVRTQIESISDLVAPVLIRGETGTGKELVARAIHENSPRRAGPFVAVNLGMLSRELAVAELFGARRGSFTGATQDRDGYFQAARGGTLFLDELGEAPLDVQGMLLRVLEEGVMYPVGASTPVPVDVRILAATDANLEVQIKKERFKEPLKYRLAKFEIRTVPLRERREDIGVLVHHFAKEELRTIGESHRLNGMGDGGEPWLPAALAARMVDHNWRGNIRQLRNIVFQIAMGSRGQATTKLGPELEALLSDDGEAAEPHSSPRAPKPPSAPPPAPRSRSLRKPSSVSEEELIAALRAHAWEPKATADALGISRPSLYDRIDRSPNIRKAGDVSVEEIRECFRECGGDLDRMVARLEVSQRGLTRRLLELGLVEKKRR